MVDSLPADFAGRSTMRTKTPASLEQRQVAAIKHGLYVKAPPGKRRHQYRAGRLLGRLLLYFEARGRPLTPLQAPLARSWAEMQVLASDLYGALQAGEGGDKGLQHYLAIRRIQLAHAIALGMSPSSETALARDLAELAKKLDVDASRKYMERYTADKA